ncbi:MAG TPA: hypothetical protein VEL76_16935 [Gemmataceae bacterium]|nr:hypothetical protein [Gemmataceae bacterium]
MATHEQDLRLGILNTLLTTPHRQLEQIWPVHRDLIAKDPRFYVQLAAWYADHGDVRDHKEMFVVSLALSEFDGHRDVGLALLRELPPYQVLRVLDFIHGRKTTRIVRPAASKGKAKAAVAAEGEAAPTKVVEDFGLFRNVPRSLRTEVTRYLREREAEPDWFDSSALTARKALKRLYALLHVAPGERAQKILFDEEPPAGSRLFALKELAKATTPGEQARAITEQRIPYRVAATVVREMTPEVLRALVGVMSPQEVINNLGALKQRGAFADGETKAGIEAKLEAARGDQRVSAYKAQVAAEAAKATGELAAKLDQVTEARVKSAGRITRPTALLIDKSASMHEAIEVGRQIGAMVSAVCEGGLFAYTFDGTAHPVEVRGTALADWEEVLAGVFAGGATSCGSALEMMRRLGQRVEQVVVVTDEHENQSPRFKDAYTAYCGAFAKPDVILVKVGQAGDTLEKACAELGVAPRVFTFGGDYYALTNLIPLLTQPSMLELLIQIMEYPLPRRRSA